MRAKNEKPQSQKHADMIGKKFGRLTVVSISDEYPVEWFGAMITCKCECGNEHEVGRRYLTRGQSKSCGCLAKASRAFYTHKGV